MVWKKICGKVTKGIWTYQQKDESTTGERNVRKNGDHGLAKKQEREEDCHSYFPLKKYFIHLVFPT